MQQAEDGRALIHYERALAKYLTSRLEAVGVHDCTDLVAAMSFSAPTHT